MLIQCCLQESGTITVSLDALFGLCRKISAGKSVREPLSGTSVFEEQSAVDAFVDSYNPKEKSLESNVNLFVDLYSTSSKIFHCNYRNATISLRVMLFGQSPDTRHSMKQQ